MEEEITTFENDSASSASSIGPTKSRRGRSQGSKKLQVCVKDLHLMELVSGISNTQPQKKRGHPRPSHTKDDGGNSRMRGGDDGAKDLGNGGSVKPRGRSSGGSPAKTGRPKSSLNRSRKRGWESCGSGAEDDEGRSKVKRERGRPRQVVSHTEDTPSGMTGERTGFRTLLKCVEVRHQSECSNTEEEIRQRKRKRGHPKPSGTKYTEDSGQGGDSMSLGSEDEDDGEDMANGGEDEGSRAVPRKRGRPKGSLNKYRRGMWESCPVGEEDIESVINLRGGRGRPWKLVSQTGVTPNGMSEGPRRPRGRPKKIGLAPSGGDSLQVKRGRGRPKGSLNKKPRAQHSVQMYNYVRRRRPGRPKKHEVRQRGRPRKNPLPPPEELKKPRVWKPLGRPRKYPRPDASDDEAAPPRRKRGRPHKSSKKGAHLRKPRPLHKPTKALAPPPAHRREGEAPRKRGRPKGSLNKNRFRGEIEIPSLNRITSSSSHTEASASDQEEM